jgi:hypothetical protein
MHRRTLAGLVVVLPFALTVSASAKTRAPVKPAHVSLVEAPLGLQGAAGAGALVAIPFRLRDQSFRPTDVQMQYAFDRNGDGLITDDEFRPATEARFDPRDTRQNRAPQLFRTAADQGAAQAIVWRSDIDLGTARLVAGPEYALDPQGRRIKDPFDPDSFVVARVNPGVVVRLRSVSVSGAKGAWTLSDPFSVSGNHPPSMTIDAVQDGGPIVATWTVTDADSEDLNGNGLLDIAAGEDRNQNGVLDTTRAGVAFDWYQLEPGEDPSTMTDVQLAAKTWHACTRVVGVGDTDAMILSPGQPPQGGVVSGAPSAPKTYAFAWDALHDAGPTTAGFVLRATPFDEHGDHGATVYSRIVAHE